MKNPRAPPRELSRPISSKINTSSCKFLELSGKFKKKQLLSQNCLFFVAALSQNRCLNFFVSNID